MALKNRHVIMIVVLAALLLFTGAAAAASISNSSVTDTNVYAGSNQNDIAPSGYYDATVTTSGISHVSGRYIALLTGASLTNDATQAEPKLIDEIVTFTINGQQGAAVYRDGEAVRLGYVFNYGLDGSQAGNNPFTATYSSDGEKNVTLNVTGWNGSSSVPAGPLTSTAYIGGGAPEILSFTTSPAAGSYAAVGDTVTISATIDTEDAVVYAWYYTTDTNPSVSSQWVKIGADTTTGSTTYVLETVAGYTFKVIVTKGTESTDSFDTAMTSLLHTVGHPVITQDAAIGTTGYVTDVSYDTVSGPLNQSAYLSATANAAGGTITYQWYDGNTIIPGATTVQYTAANTDADNTTHEYYLRISSVEVPAVYTDTRHVFLNTYKDPVVSTSPQYGDATDIVTLSADGSGYTAVQWKVSKDGGAYADLSTTNPYTYAPGAAGVYTYQAVFTYPAGYVKTIDGLQTVTLYAEPQLTTSPQYGDLGDTVTLTATETGYTTVQWKVSTDGIIYTDLGTTNPYSYVPQAAGTYHYQAVFTYPGSHTQTVTAADTVTIYTESSITVSPVEGGITDTVTLTATDTGYTSLQWKVSKDGGAYADLSTTNPYTYTPGAAGVYTYQAVFTYSGGHIQTITAADTVAIYLEPTITVSPTVGDLGDAVTLTATDTGYTSMQWKVSKDGGAYADLSTANPHTYTPTAAGVYTYQAVVTYPGGYTQTVTAADTVTLYAEPELIVTPIVGDLGDIITLSTTNTGYTAVQWKVSTDGITYTDLGTTNPYSYVPQAAGTYHYQAVFTYPGSHTQTVTAADDVIIYAHPVITIPVQICSEGDTVTLTATETGYTAVQWKVSTDGTTYTDLGTGNPYGYVPDSGTYYYQAVFTYPRSHTNTITSTDTVTVYDNPVISISPVIGFLDSEITLSATDTGYTGVEWYAGKDGAQAVSVGTGNPYSYIPGAAGSYTYSGLFSYPGGYTKQISSDITVSIYMTPTATVQPIRGGLTDTYTLNTQNLGSDYQWYYSTDNGATWDELNGAVDYTYDLVPNTAGLTAGAYIFKAVYTYQSVPVTTTNTTTVNIYAEPTITVSPTVGGTTDTITLTATDTGYTSLQWKVSKDGGTYADLSTTNPYTYTPGAAGVYTYQAVFTYPGGYTQTVTAADTVTIYATPALTVSPTVGGTTDAVTLTATDTGYTSMQWKVSKDGGAYADLSTTNPYTYTPGTAGVYTYQAVFTYPGGYTQTVTAADTVTIYVEPTITVSPTVGGTTDAVTLTATDTGYTSMQWKVSKDGGTYADLSTTNPYTYTPGAAGVYTYQAVFTYPGGYTQTVTAADTVTIYATPALTVSPTVGGTTDTVTLTATDTGYTSLQWKVSKDGGTYADLSTTNPYTYTPGAAGVYTYQAVFTYPGGYTQTVTAADTVTIYATPALTVSPTVGGTTDTVTLTATDTGYTSLQWKVSKDGGAYADLSTTNPYTYTPGAAGVYTYQAVFTYTGGYTQTVTAADTVTIYATPALTVSPTVGGTTDTVTLTATDTGYTSLQWKVSKNGGEFTNIGTTNPYSYIPGEAGTYQYRAVFTYHGGYSQTVATEQTVKIYNIPQLTISPIVGGVGDRITLLATNTGYSYMQWEVSTNGINYTPLSTTNPYSYSPAVGTYYYKGIFTYEGGYTQTVTAADTVTIYATPALTVSPTVGGTMTPITLTATDTGYTSLQWKVSKDGGAYTDLSTTNPYTYTPGVVSDYTYQAVFIYPGGYTQTISAQSPVVIYADPIPVTPGGPAVPVAVPYQATLTAAVQNPETVVSYYWQLQTGGTWVRTAEGSNYQPRLTTPGQYVYRFIAVGHGGQEIPSPTITIDAGYAPSADIIIPAGNEQYDTGDTVNISAIVGGTDATYIFNFGSHIESYTGETGTVDEQTKTIAASVTYQAIREYKTIKLTVTNRYGTAAADTVQIVYGQPRRPAASSELTHVDTSGLEGLIEDVAPQTVDNQMPDITKFITDLTKPFTDVIGEWFWLLVFAVPFLIMWIRQKNLLIPSILGVLFAAWLLVFLPGTAMKAAIGIIILAVAGGIYGLYVRTHRT